MGTRLELHQELVDAIGNPCIPIYFQLPEGTRMSYPCVKYDLDKGFYNYADNIKYLTKKLYTVTIIETKADSELIGKIEKLDYATFDRTYKSDGLYHHVFTVYY